MSCSSRFFLLLYAISVLNFWNEVKLIRIACVLELRCAPMFFSIINLHICHCILHTHTFIDSFDRRWSRLVSLYFILSCHGVLYHLCAINMDDTWPLDLRFCHWLHFWSSRMRLFFHNFVVCPLKSIYNRNIHEFIPKQQILSSCLASILVLMCMCVYAICLRTKFNLPVTHNF